VGAAQDFLACYPSDPIQHPFPEHCEIAPVSLPWPVSGAGHCLYPRSKGAERKGPRDLTGHLRNCSGREARITKEKGVLLSCSIFFSCPGCTLALEHPGSQNVHLSQRATRSKGRRLRKGKRREQHPSHPTQPALGPVSKADTFFPSIPSYDANSGLRIGPWLLGELDESTDSLQLPAPRGCGQRNRNTSLWLFPASFLADRPQFT